MPNTTEVRINLVSEKIGAYDFADPSLFGDLMSTASWRMQKLAEHPDDMRNLGAAEELVKLAEQCNALGDNHPLMQRYTACVYRPEFEDEAMDFSRLQSEALKAIGFRAGYDSAEELLNALLDDFERAAA